MSRHNITEIEKFITGKKKPKKFAATVYLTMEELNKLDEMAETFSTSRTGVVCAMINVYYKEGVKE